MATSTIHPSHLILLSSLLLLSFSSTSSLAQTSFRPKALVLPVTKDISTLQFVTHIHQRTPLVPLSLVVDLGGRHFWVDCDDPSYVSSTYSSPRCRSAQCSLAQTNGCGQCFSLARPGCNNNTCAMGPENSVTRTATGGELASDVVSVLSTDGSNLGRAVRVSQFLFACGSTFLLDGLALGVKGMAGLGRTKISFPSQLSSAFSFRREFAICLPSSTNSTGVIFFGPGPYKFLPNIDASMSLGYTPLLNNPVSTATSYTAGEPSYEYFIDINAIRVEDMPIQLNATLLTIDRNGNGGTKISTVVPYTVLEASIFKAVSEVYISKMAGTNVMRVKPVKPFDVCFSSKNIEKTSIGPEAPYIYLTRQNQQPVWAILGSNSLVQVNNEVMCLAFINGGANPTTSIVIGAYQLQDNLLHFDLAKSRVGFSSTLLNVGTSCAKFNFSAIGH
ncbi:hypothetical protein CDL15_Pgr002619 [Punica granatum]|uniref:Peptidase A1 domain-containing protein n=1 Tax=Punica granatum TaxID=22663 RepID=A0A218W1U8_PUNGR|nr:hypothetical protein CDL15_Pgr002619 [Punica granatum]